MGISFINAHAHACLSRSVVTNSVTPYKCTFLCNFKAKKRYYTIKKNWRMLKIGNWLNLFYWIWGFPGSSVGKESACSAGDPGLIPGSGRSPGEGNGKPLQYPCPENLMDSGAWWAAVHESQRVGHDWETQFSSVAQSCLTLCDPMNCSPPGLPVHHQLRVYPNSCPLSRWCHRWLVGLRD